MKMNLLKTHRRHQNMALTLIASLMMSSSFSMTNHDTTLSNHSDNPMNALAIHNKFRAQHHAPNLTWDTTLADYAKNHANKCVFQHSKTPYGENLAAGYPSISAAVSAWYTEHENYSYSRPGFSMRTGHFTQLVWKSSKKLGCAYVSCNGKNGTPGKYLVCEYSPAGNITNRGYFNANVLPS